MSNFDSDQGALSIESLEAIPAGIAVDTSIGEIWRRFLNEAKEVGPIAGILGFLGGGVAGAIQNYAISPRSGDLSAANDPNISEMEDIDSRSSRLNVSSYFVITAATGVAFDNISVSDSIDITQVWPPPFEYVVLFVGVPVFVIIILAIRKTSAEPA